MQTQTVVRIKTSPAHGTVTFDVWGESVQLRFSWRSVESLIEAFGDQWQARVKALSDEQDIATIATMLEIGSGRPREWWYDQSPPINRSIEALSAALLVAFNGPDDRPPPDPLQRPSRLCRWCLRLFGRGVSGA